MGRPLFSTTLPELAPVPAVNVVDDEKAALLKTWSQQNDFDPDSDEFFRMENVVYEAPLTEDQLAQRRANEAFHRAANNTRAEFRRSSSRTPEPVFIPPPPSSFSMRRGPTSPFPPDSDLDETHPTLDDVLDEWRIMHLRRVSSALRMALIEDALGGSPTARRQLEYLHADSGAPVIPPPPPDSPHRRRRRHPRHHEHRPASLHPPPNQTSLQVPPPPPSAPPRMPVIPSSPTLGSANISSQPEPDMIHFTPTFNFDTSLFDASELNFDRDFGAWFNPGEELPVGTL